MSPLDKASALTFAVIGDFGVGVRKDSDDRHQQKIGDALRTALDAHDIRFMLTTGDNIYAKTLLGFVPIGSSGDDDDWFFTFFQPYRYVINRICVYPSIGNHDTNESEQNDDRGQVEDNFYLRERIAGEEAAGRASVGPGLFYRFRYGTAIEFICLDTSKEHFFAKRLFDHPSHQDFVDASFGPDVPAPIWRIPFCHHPPFSAGPRHHNTESMHRLIPLFHRAGVKALFSGHEHNFQHSAVDGINYFVSGAAGKVRPETPNRFAEAHTESWSNKGHFLLVEIVGDRLTVRPIGELGADATLTDIRRWGPGGGDVTEPIVIRV